MNKWISSSRVKPLTKEQKLKNLEQRIRLLRLEEIIWENRKKNYSTKPNRRTTINE